MITIDAPIRWIKNRLALKSFRVVTNQISRDPRSRQTPV